MNIIKYTFFTYTCVFISGFSGGTSGKQPVCPSRRHKRCEFNPWVGRIPWKRAWWPTPIFLPGESHGQRSLVGYSPWGHRVEHDWSDLATAAADILASINFSVQVFWGRFPMSLGKCKRSRWDDGVESSRSNKFHLFLQKMSPVTLDKSLTLQLYYLKAQKLELWLN